MNTLYLDYAATTPCDAAVVETMLRYLGEGGLFANPASRSHRPGWMAEQVVENARLDVAGLIKADPREIVWTSGATEANNLAIKGSCEFYEGRRGRHLVTSVTEHKAVLDVMRYLAGKGYDVTFLRPGPQGVITAQHVEDVLRDDTFLVSLMWVNNETGVKNPIEEIAELTRSRKIVLHVDAAQAVGKCEINVSQVPLDLMSFSGHKLYGPKGVGALFVRREPFVGVFQQIHGGGHERGMRSGTLPTHQIAGFGAACRIASERWAQDAAHLQTVKDAFLAAIQGRGLDFAVNGHADERIPGILNLSIAGVNSETLMAALPQLALSSGSACNSATVEPSHVLTGMDIPRSEALNALRISFGRFTTIEQVREAAGWLVDAVASLKR